MKLKNIKSQNSEISTQSTICNLNEDEINRAVNKIVKTYKEPYKRTKIKKVLTLLTLGTGFVAFGYAFNQDYLLDWLTTYASNVVNTSDPNVATINLLDLASPKAIGTLVGEVGNDCTTDTELSKFATAFGATFGARTLASIIPSTTKKKAKNKIAEKIKHNELDKDDVKELTLLSKELGTSIAIAPEVHLAKLKYKEESQEK